MGLHAERLSIKCFLLFLKQLYYILNNYITVGDLEEKRLLDIGTGPVIFTAISPSRRVREITLSDYIPDCLDELTKWLNNEEGAFDWSYWTQHAASLEGNR